MFWIGVIWCGLAVLLTAFFFALPILAAHNTTGGKPAAGTSKDIAIPWPVWVGLACFDLVGLATLVGGLNQCRRRGSLEITDQLLRVEQVSLFRCRRREWPRDHIVAIQTGPSGFTLGGGTRPTGVAIRGGIRIAELHVHLTDGKRIRLFTGRSEAELDWIAGQLRQLLHVGTRKYDED